MLRSTKIIASTITAPKSWLTVIYDRIPLTFILGWVVFNLNLLLPLGYIGDVLTIIYLLPILGLSIFRLFIPTPKSSTSLETIERFLFSIGIGILNILAIGLIVNFIPSPIDNGYMKTPYLWIAFNIEAVVIFILYIKKIIIKPKRIKKIENSIIKKRDVTSYVLAITTLSLAVIGAISLNNQASSFFAICSTLMSIVAIIYMLFKPGGNVQLAISIYLIAASYLLAGWLRSNYISAVDTNAELYIFNTIYDFGKWAPSIFPGHAYNACLSITVLPTVIQSFIKIEPAYIFKFIFPLLYSAVAPIIFVSARHVLGKRISLIAPTVYISQPAFMTYISIPARQQIALLFFALLIMTILGCMQYKQKRFLVIFLFLGILLSHYTSAYIALAVLVIAYLIEKIISWSMKKKSSTNSHLTIFSLITVIALISSTYLWNNTITSSSKVASSFISKNLNNLDMIFDPTSQTHKASLINQFNPFYKPQSPQSKLDEFYKEIQNKNNINGNYSAPKIAPQTLAFSKISEHLSLFSSVIKSVVQIFCKLLIIFGTIYLIRQYLILRGNTRAYSALMSSAALTALGLLLLLPFLSETYDASRTFQQILIVLSIPLAASVESICRMNQKYILLFSSLLIIALIGFGNGLINQLIGGGDPSINYNNAGKLYDRLYVDKGEITSSAWLNDQGVDKAIFADRMAIARLTLTQKYGNELEAKQSVFDGLLYQDRYVYLRRQNLQGTGSLNIKGTQYDYIYPNDKLNETKNRIYSNSSSQVYK